MTKYVLFENVRDFKDYILNSDSGFDAVEERFSPLESCNEGHTVSKISFDTADNNTIEVYFRENESKFVRIIIKTESGNTINIKCKKKIIGFAFDEDADEIWENNSNKGKPNNKEGNIVVIKPNKENKDKPLNKRIIFKMHFNKFYF